MAVITIVIIDIFISPTHNWREAVADPEFFNAMDYNLVILLDLNT